MNSFLCDVAKSLHLQYGDSLAQTDVVFASRRAIIYFKQELQAIGAKLPRCYSMDNWITNHQESVKVESRFILISKLYEIYSKYHPDEDFEKFYSFGNLIISDFDMIDRYMVDARQLYSIVSDTKEIDAHNDDSIRQAATEFWHSFDKKNAERHKQQEFLRVWRSLYDIYVEFTQLIDSENIAYSGRIYRQVAQQFDLDKHNRKTIFVGLNALSNSEKEILSKLNNRNLADFIWDYDKRWFEDENSECGYFISRNIKELPQADYFSTTILEPQNVNIEVIEAPSDAGQVKLLPQLLREINDKVGKVDERVAIILTDENLILPLLYSLPESISELNISMGYPLRATLAYRFVELLVRLQRRVRNSKFYLGEISALLNHPYFSHYKDFTSTSTYLLPSDLPPTLQVLWQISNSSSISLHNYLIAALKFVQTLEIEAKELGYITQIIDSMEVTWAMIAQAKQEISTQLYLSLLNATISEQSIEFEGVSGKGLQIIGILESRTLDFDRVIMLSMNDDNFPSSRPDSSYIPQLLLQGYGMPTIDEKSAIWSYYFYRLLQRSNDVNLIYCNVADGMTTGEQSRYIWQLEYSSPFTVMRRRVSIGSMPITSDNQIEIPNSDAIIDKVKSLRYYPTMLSAYHNCPLSFYFASIERIKRQDIEDEKVTAADTGNLLHKVMYNLYLPFKGKQEVRRYISTINDQQINEEINKVIADELKEKVDNEQAMVQIARTTVGRMVCSIVEYDALRDDIFAIEHLEQRVEGTIAGVKFAGVIDRVDRLTDGSLRVIDYKSGSVDFKIDSIEMLFDENEPSARNAVIAQIMIYSVLARKKWNVDISPAIYAARQMANAQGGFSPEIVISKDAINRLDLSHYQLIEQSIADTFDRMCNIEQPFIQTNQLRTCQYCNYRLICRR